MKRSDKPLNGSSPTRGLPRSRLVLFFSIAIGGCTADLLTKQWTFNWLGPPDGQDNTWWLIEPYVGIQTAVNQGALFGMGQGMSAWFALLSVVAAVGIFVWLFCKGGARDLLLTIALSSVTGGIFGNLYDRLGLWHSSDAPAQYQHGVRDWMLLQYKDYTWPNFNIADSLLVCGAVLLVVHAFFKREPQSAQADTKSAEQPTGKID